MNSINMDQTEEKLKVLGELNIQIKRSELAYRNYMANGKKFIYTKIIKKCNEAILNLLVGHSHLFADDMIEGSLRMIEHIDIWMEKWIDLEQTKKPGLEDEFVFENKVSFPRDVAQKIEAAFLSLREKK